MFENIKKRLNQIRNYDEGRRKKIVFALVAVIFGLVCVVWVVVLVSGFGDFNGRWISGTRTYTASGTETYDTEIASSFQSSWDMTRGRISQAWDQLVSAFGELSSVEVSSSTASSSHIGTSTDANTTVSSTNSSSTLP